MNIHPSLKPRTLLSNSARIGSIVLGSVVLFLSAISEEALGKLDVPKSIRNAVFTASTEKGSGTAFACKYKGKEFVATNLHIAAGTTRLVIKTQQGDTIPLGNKIILTADADICLISVKIPFAELGITPLEFIDNVYTDTKVGDEVYCMGNSLGNKVIIQSDGKIKAFGNLRLETTTPFVGGNSGGPLIHFESQKVVALITESLDNSQKDPGSLRNKRAIKDADSELSKISYFGHRIDTVKKWSGTSYTQFLENEKELMQYEKSIDCTRRFLYDLQGWREDKELVDIWRTYTKFINEASKRTSSSVKVTRYVNDFGTVLRSDIRRRSKTVSQVDYDKAYQTFVRRLEWKIEGDEKNLKKMKALGYIQNEMRAGLEEWAEQVKVLIRELHR
jgi:hypothetical protein